MMSRSRSLALSDINGRVAPNTVEPTSVSNLLIVSRECRPRPGNPFAGTRMTVALLMACIPTGFSACLGPTRAEVPTLDDSCTLSVAEPSPVMLADGQALGINVSSVAVNHGAVAIVGTPTYLWPKNAGQHSGLLRRDSVIGAIRDPSGAFVAIPSPLPGRPLLQPKVTSAGSAGWHVVFITGRQGTPRSALTFPRATVWYGMFDGRSWSDVRQVTDVRYARLLATFSSDLVATHAGLSFAFAFDQTLGEVATTAETQGVVLLQQRAGQWVADTLYTWAAPTYVRLAPTADSAAISVLLAQSHFSDQRPHPPALFISRYDSVWNPLTMVAGDRARSVVAPVLRSYGTHDVIAWQSHALSGSGNVDIEWIRGRIPHSMVAPSRIAQVEPFDGFAVAALSPNRMLWMTREAGSRRNLRIVMTTDTSRSDFGIVSLPLDNIASFAIATSDSSALVVTGELSRSATQPLAVSYVSHLGVSCPRQK